MKKISGWDRLFIVYAFTHLVVVIIFCFYKPASFWNLWRRTHHVYFPSTTEWLRLEYILTHGILPIMGVFLLGLAISWAIKGFNKEKEENENR